MGAVPHRAARHPGGTGRRCGRPGRSTCAAGSPRMRRGPARRSSAATCPARDRGRRSPVTALGALAGARRCCAPGRAARRRRRAGRQLGRSGGRAARCCRPARAARRGPARRRGAGPRPCRPRPPYAAGPAAAPAGATRDDRRQRRAGARRRPGRRGRPGCGVDLDPAALRRTPTAAAPSRPQPRRPTRRALGARRRGGALRCWRRFPPDAALPRAASGVVGDRPGRRPAADGRRHAAGGRPAGTTSAADRMRHALMSCRRGGHVRLPPVPAPRCGRRRRP